MKKNFFKLFFITLCLTSLSRCNKIRNPELFKTKTYLELAYKKTGASDVVIPANDETVFLGTGTDQYQSVKLTYKERGMAVTEGIKWNITSTKTPLPTGITQKNTDDGYEFTVDLTNYVLKEDFDIKIVVLRYNTVLVESIIKVKEKTLPNVQNILIRRKKGQENTKVKKGAMLDLNTVFEIVVLPIGASFDVIWKVDNSSLATIDEKGVITAIGIGTVNISASPVSSPTITSTALPLILDANIKTLQIKDLTFDVDALTTSEILVAWIIYKDSGGNEIVENLGEVKLKKDGLTVTPGPILVSEVKLIENNTIFIITVEEPSIKTDDRVIRAISKPSNKRILIGFVNAADRFYRLNFLGNTNFSNPSTNGDLSSFVMYSPTDDVIGNVVNDEAGIWFVKDTDSTISGIQPSSSLNLPALPETGSWVYEAWVVVSTNFNISLGKFFDPKKADKNAFYYSNTSKAPSFPGEDLLINKSSGAGVLSPNPFPIDVRNRKVFVTIEPASDLASSDLIPFFLTILEGQASNSTGATINHTLTSKVPSGQVQVK